MIGIGILLSFINLFTDNVIAPRKEGVELSRKWKNRSEKYIQKEKER
jgi:hypothetical protein